MISLLILTPNILLALTKIQIYGDVLFCILSLILLLIMILPPLQLFIAKKYFLFQQTHIALPCKKMTFSIGQTKLLTEIFWGHVASQLTHKTCCLLFRLAQKTLDNVCQIYSPRLAKGHPASKWIGSNHFLWGCHLISVSHWCWISWL